VTEAIEPDPSDLTTHTALRRLLARHAIGYGIEVGPGHQPFELPFVGSSVRFVDRWQPEENRELFPELGDLASFPVPDVVANFDTDRLHPIADASQDFVVCSHVIEHLAEPIGFLAEIYRVLRPGGIAIVLLPNRHRTFDRRREPTSLEHLIAEYQANVTDVDEDHLVEFLSNTIGLPEEPGELAEALELHRNRSIHVHCWDEEEFVPVLRYAIEQCGMLWEFVDGLVTDDLGEEGFEFGFVLRRSTSPDRDANVLGQRLVESWECWRDARLANLEELRSARSNLALLEREVARLHAHVADLAAAVAARDASVERLHRHPVYRAYRFLKPVRPKLPRSGSTRRGSS
jgi:SAM-dependent methyltransferase